MSDEIQEWKKLNSLAIDTVKTLDLMAKVEIDQNKKEAFQKAIETIEKQTMFIMIKVFDSISRH